MTAPLKEVKSNLASTTLNGAIDGSTTTVVVTTGSVFPSTGRFRILIESEIMIVTARSTNTLTVIRGQEGTSGASHADTTPVYHPITNDAFLTLARQNWRQPYKYGLPYGIFDTNGSDLLDTSDFTWVNQGDATITDQNGTILLLTPPPVSAPNLRILARSHSAPNTYIAAFQCIAPIGAGGSQAMHFGLGFRQSSSGKFTVQMHVCQAQGAATGAYKLQVRDWDGPGPAATFNTIRSEHAITCVHPAFWMKVEDDNTNMKFFVGMDSENWIQIHSVGRLTHMLTTGPDQVIWYGQNSGTENDALFRLVHFSRV